MAANILQKRKYELGLLLILVCLVIYKLPFLKLPYFWDEAWPYSVGVNEMYKHGLSLLPGAVPPFIARGHPLMFHFLAAAWMKMFGTSLISGHAFAMAVSLLLVVTVYISGTRFFSNRVGFIAALLFAAQPVLISQSAFLMPEVMVGLWAMLAFYFYFQKKAILFVLSASALILTKEPGAMVIVTLFFYETGIFLFSDPRIFRDLLRKLVLIVLPVFMAGLYFLAQKIKFGWFLYPFYMDHLSSNWINVKENLPSGAAYVFIYYGRNGLSIFIIISIVVLLLKKERAFSADQKKILGILSCFVVFFLLFSTVNYYIPRYLLCAFPPLILTATALMDKAFGRRPVIYALIISGLVGTFIYFYGNGIKNGDIDYSPSIRTDMQVVSFCEQAHLQQAHIFANSVLRIDFNEPVAGYLSGPQFTNIESDFSQQTEYCIFSSDETTKEQVERITREYNISLVKRFELGYAWKEIYKVNR